MSTYFSSSPYIVKGSMISVNPKASVDKNPRNRRHPHLYLTRFFVSSIIIQVAIYSKDKSTAAN